MSISRTIRGLFKRIFPQLNTERAGVTLGHAVLSTPMPIPIPALHVGRTATFVLKKIPVIKEVKITGLPYIGPILVGVQTALAARAALDSAKHTMDQFAGGLVTVHGPMPLDSDETTVTAAGEHLLGRGSAAISGFGTGAAFLGAQARGLGEQIEKSKGASNQAATQRRVTLFGGISQSDA
ncbi:uncharacterized protein PG986_000007 [Apiospora aurea]|uniref:Uncharacterized protein n=1 Tax=Apiospora aurea TaxID=335848 RepID=A0ABR1QUD3_9PEZI